MVRSEVVAKGKGLERQAIDLLVPALKKALKPKRTKIMDISDAPPQIQRMKGNLVVTRGKKREIGIEVKAHSKPDTVHVGKSLRNSRADFVIFVCPLPPPRGMIMAVEHGKLVRWASRSLWGECFSYEEVSTHTLEKEVGTVGLGELI